MPTAQALFLVESAWGNGPWSNPGDVSKPEDVERAVARTVDQFGALHYAGISGVVLCRQYQLKLASAGWSVECLACSLCREHGRLRPEPHLVCARGGACPGKDQIRNGHRPIPSDRWRLRTRSRT